MSRRQRVQVGLSLGCHLQGVIGSRGSCFYFLAVQMRPKSVHGALASGSAQEGCEAAPLSTCC